MATYDLMQKIDKYFQDNWITTEIQFPGQSLDDTTLDDFISLKYEPVDNTPYGMDGTATGRIEYMGLYKVYCYAKSDVKAFILADAVKTFLNGKQLDDVYVEIGQDNSVNDLHNNLHETICVFNVSQWA